MSQTLGTFVLNVQYIFFDSEFTDDAVSIASTSRKVGCKFQQALALTNISG